MRFLGVSALQIHDSLGEKDKFVLGCKTLFRFLKS